MEPAPSSRKRSRGRSAKKAAPEASQDAKAPDAREAARLAAWEAPPADTGDADEVIGDPQEEPSDPLSWHEMVGDLHRLGTRFVLFARSSRRDESALVASRIVDGLYKCLHRPPEARKALLSEMNKAGAILNRICGNQGAQIPERLARLNIAEDLLARIVEPPLELGGTDEQIADFVEMGRACCVHQGSMEILPSSGTREERIALFVGAIAKRRSSIDGDKRLDPEAVISACARACGNRHKLFEARRKAVKR